MTHPRSKLPAPCHPTLARRILLGMALVLLIPILVANSSSSAPLSKGILDTGPIAGLGEIAVADEEDVFNKAPFDPDPADSSPNTTLHPGSHARKIGTMPAAHARVLFILATLAGESIRTSASEPGRQSKPHLPYFQAYPVCLIGDLPPPAA